MRKWQHVLCIGALLLAVPHIAMAQSAIAGNVKDTTGLPLPGVLIEVSSPALIEGTKTTTSDGSGQYRVVDLRPGTYTVTFTLGGFAQLARSGIVLESNFTAPVNVEMTVATVNETITVSGASPVVDVQNSQRRELVSQELIDVLPTGRSAGLMANTVPAVSTTSFDVGGSSNSSSPGLTVHGSLTGDARTLIDGFVVDGMALTGQCQCLYDNEAQTQEIAVQVSGGSAENQLSGVLVNRIPRSGGNSFSGDQKILYSWPRLQSENLDDELRARGLSTPPRIARSYDINYSLGGPIIRNRFWFFASGRNWSYNNYPANVFNPDGSRAVDDNVQRSYPVRLTAQITRRDRVTGLIDYSDQKKGHQNLAPNVSPEATLIQKVGPAYIGQVKWTTTPTNTLLVEAGYNYTRTVGDNQYQSSVVRATCFVAYNLCPPGTSYGDIAHQDTLLGTSTVASPSGPGAFSGPNTNRHASNYAQASLAYVSGTHNLKIGFQDRWGWTTATRLDFNGDLNQMYRNGVPFAVTILNVPSISQVDVDADLGVYVQDTWTRRRLTLSGGVRWDYFKSSIPVQSVDAGRFVAARSFEAIDDVPNWSSITPRFGGSYDLSGNGKTAVKGNIGLYVQSQGPGFAGTYNPMIVSTDQRTWSDLNRDDIAQENEIGPPTNLAFGVRRNQNMDPDIKRPYQLVWDVGVQRELMEGVGLSVSYNRRRFYDPIWTQNLAVNPVDDYTLMSIPDPRGNGETLPLYNLAPSKLGLVDELDRTSALNRSWYQGVDVSVNVRLPRATLYGGTSTGRTLSVACQVADPNNLRFCDQTLSDVPFRTLFKLAGSVLLPYGIRLSGTLQSTPNTERVIIYQVTRAVVPTLTQTSVNIRLNEPGADFNDRVNQLDLNITRGFRVPVAGRSVEFRPELGIFNVFNANPVLNQLNTYGPTLGNVTSILNPRLARLGLSVRF